MNESYKITSWSIAVTYADGTRAEIVDMPDGVADTVDEFLTTQEELYPIEENKENK